MRRAFGFWSTKQANLCGVLQYRTPSGSEVFVTAVSEDATGSAYRWDDLEAVGEVVPVEDGGFVRRLSRGSYPEFSFTEVMLPFPRSVR